MNLTEGERIARLRLIRSQSVGPISFYKLLSRFGSAVTALDELPNLAAKAGRKTPKIMMVHEASNELDRLSQFGGSMVVYGDDNYPKWLSNIADAPPVLNVIGDVSFLSKSCVGIVGARNASANAKRYTMSLASELGQKGQVIISGMARGIDTAAHEASLDTGTIAVLAGGLDEIYPTENTDLYHQIIEKGCVISEMPLGTKPTAHHFPRRNRIVSGVSKGVIVVEASMKSGSLITARLAGEQGREVFAVPGFPGDPRAAGPNYLIQNGAKLIQNANDVLEEIMAMNAKAIQPQQQSFDNIAEEYETYDENHQPPENTYEIVMQNLSMTPLDMDVLIRSCDISAQDLQICLLDLELAGAIERHAGNRVSKVV